MAINANLLIAAPMLQDYLVDKTGVPLAAGIVTLYQDNNRTTFKNWYYQSGSPGAYTYIALPNPMTLSAAGTIQDAMGNDTIPFFYPFDEADQTVAQPYYITVDNANLQRQFTRQNFPYNPNGGSSGSTVQTLSNTIINNQFWRNIGTLTATTLASTVITGTPLSTSTAFYATVAPSQHDGYTFSDINFLKNANGGVDTITFTKFPQSSTPALTGDITPEYFLRHQASTGGGETLKYYQFPISLHVQTLDLANFTATIQAINNTGGAPGNTIQLYLYQYCGSGQASPAPIPIGAPIVLNNSWQKYERTASFPSDAAITLSTGGDDAWFLQVGLAPNATLDISFTLPSLFLGTTVPTNSFTTYDQVNAIISSPRTGDVRTSLNAFMPFGWTAMNDGTIGNAAVKTAPTTGVGFSRQNNDTWPLFNLIWNALSQYNNTATNLLAQMFDSAGNAVTYGATAIADWVANKQLSLTKMMGQVILGTVPLSSVIGASTIAYGRQQQYTATFTATQLGETLTASSSSGNLLITNGGTIPFYYGQPIVFSNSGGALPTGLVAATQYFAVPVSPTTLFVATTLQNALDNVLIAFGGAGSGTNTISTFGLVLTAANALSTFNGAPITFSNTGGALPTGINATTVYYVISMSSTIISVATTFNNAIQGIPINYTDAGTGTHTLYLNGVATYEGEYGHAQTEFELASHYHNYSLAGIVNLTVGATAENAGTTALNPTDSRGHNQLANVTQPGTFMNIFIKL